MQLLQSKSYAEENARRESKLKDEIPDEGTLGFSIFDGESCPILINERNFAAGYQQLTFSMNLELTGPWLVGQLRSRGYGQVRKVILKGSHA